VVEDVDVASAEAARVSDEVSKLEGISFMKPRVLGFAVLASRTLSGSSSENVSVGRLSARSSVSMAATR
jgi:hypothetical protein